MPDPKEEARDSVHDHTACLRWMVIVSLLACSVDAETGEPPKDI
jgi:hypothetical protein